MIRLYRLRAFPQSPLAQYIAASMWPLPMTGVISHETALDLLGLSNVNPSKIHLTLPTSLRILRRVIPQLYVPNKADLESDEVTTLEGTTITTPVRAGPDFSLRASAPKSRTPYLGMSLAGKQ